MELSTTLPTAALLRCAPESPCPETKQKKDRFGTKHKIPAPYCCQTPAPYCSQYAFCSEPGLSERKYRSHSSFKWGNDPRTPAILSGAFIMAQSWPRRCRFHSSTRSVLSRVSNCPGSSHPRPRSEALQNHTVNGAGEQALSFRFKSSKRLTEAHQKQIPQNQDGNHGQHRVHGSEDANDRVL